MTRYEEDGMVRTDEKRISCKRCQRRKIKCSRTAPCRRCLTAGVQCEYRESDCKRAPISREYVTALECRIASLERALEMKGAVHCNHDCNVVTSAQEGRLDMSLAGSDLDGNVTQSSSNEKDTIKCHGSSDVYDTCILRAMEPERSLHIPSLETVQMDREMLPRGSFIEECLNLYFRWLHASFAIIDQAQFFAEFGSGTYSTEMCSPALVYAMSALGALVSDEPAIRTMADDYACEARRRMIPSGYPPSMSMIQAALLCAMYETGQGDQSNLWFYMGSATPSNLLLDVLIEAGIISGAMEDREHQRSRPDARLDEGKKSGTSSPVNPHDSWTRMHMNCYLSDKSPPKREKSTSSVAKMAF
ncbi:fungal specific transcription factor domain-containing protein [Phlyctema vagabunda]|uniref:Fungal specific transcription factor domain-containing protein n=1 Tax=Phlyctema vagabunda TaxID=108571 RepID=A0ABR4PYT1_9HELO